MTGYRVHITETAFEAGRKTQKAHVVAYDGTSNQIKIIDLRIRHSTEYSVVSKGMSYIDYPDFAVSVRNRATDFGYAQPMIPPHTGYAPGTISLSAFQWGSVAGATIEFWVFLKKAPTTTRGGSGVSEFFHLSDATKKHHFSLSFQERPLVWDAPAGYGTGKAGPQLVVRAVTPSGNSTNSHNSSIFTAIDCNGSPECSSNPAFLVGEWVHIAVVSYGSVPFNKHEMIHPEWKSKCGHTEHVANETSVNVPECPKNSWPKLRRHVGKIFVNGKISSDGSLPFFGANGVLWGERSGEGSQILSRFSTGSWLGHPDVVLDEVRLYDLPRPVHLLQAFMSRRYEDKERFPFRYANKYLVLDSLAVYFDFDDTVSIRATGTNRLVSLGSDMVAPGWEMFEQDCTIAPCTGAALVADASGFAPSWQFWHEHWFGSQVPSSNVITSWKSNEVVMQFTRNQGITISISVASDESDAEVVFSPQMLNLTVKSCGGKGCSLSPALEQIICRLGAAESSTAAVQNFGLSPKKVVCTYDTGEELCTVVNKACLVESSQRESLDEASFLHTVRFRYFARGHGKFKLKVSISDARKFAGLRAPIRSVFVTPCSLLALWRFNEGDWFGLAGAEASQATVFGVGPDEYKVIAPESSFRAAHNKLQLHVNRQHVDWTFDTQRGPALQFDGFGSATFNSTGLDLRRSEWSITFFVRHQAIKGAVAKPTVLLSQQGTLIYSDTKGRLHIAFRATSTDAGSTGVIDRAACDSVNTDAWTHLAIAVERVPRRQARLYKDGLLCATLNMSQHAAPATMRNPSASISHQTTFGSPFLSEIGPKEIQGFRGIVSELAIWSGALNSEQIQRILRGNFLEGAPPVATVGNGEISWVNSTRGDGLASEPLLISSDREASMPSPPQFVVATKITGGALYLQIVQPIDTGGVDILGYEIVETSRSGVAKLSTKVVPFLLKANFVVGGFTKEDYQYSCKARVYCGDKAKDENIIHISASVEYGLKNGELAIFLEGTLGSEKPPTSSFPKRYSESVVIGAFVVITEAPTMLQVQGSATVRNPVEKMLSPFQITRIVSAGFTSSMGSASVPHGPFLVVSQPDMDHVPRERENPWSGGKLVFAKQSALTKDPFSFTTMMGIGSRSATPPGRPSPPFAMLASDEVMTIDFEPSTDSGGDTVTAFEVAMRDVEEKGIFTTVYTGPLSGLPFTATRAQYSGFRENRAYQIRARAFNKAAGWGKWSKIGVDSTTDLCDLRYKCIGGDAILLDWSTCAPQKATSADLVYRLVELEYNDSLEETKLSDHNTVSRVVYEGKSLRLTIWDIEAKPVVRRYRVHLMQRLSSGVLEDRQIYSSYLRVGTSENAGGTKTDLDSKLVHGSPELVCASQIDTIGAATYRGNITRTWVLEPQTSGSAVVMHQGIMLHFTRFDLECNTDALSVSIKSTGKIIWRGGCHRSRDFYVFTRAPHEAVVLTLDSDAHFSGTGFDVTYAAIPFLWKGEPFDVDDPDRAWATEQDMYADALQKSVLAATAGISNSSTSTTTVSSDGSHSEESNVVPATVDPGKIVIPPIELYMGTLPINLFSNKSFVSDLACPDRVGSRCNLHGHCLQRTASASVPAHWSCACTGRYFGESCAFEAFCETPDALASEVLGNGEASIILNATMGKSVPFDMRSNPFVHEVCAGRTGSGTLFSVWPYGRDEEGVGGTGSMGDTHLPADANAGQQRSLKAPKPVRSVRRALELATLTTLTMPPADKATGGRRRLQQRRLWRQRRLGQKEPPVRIFLYPGLYSGFDVCNATVPPGLHVQIGSIGGHTRTIIDCVGTSRFISVDGHDMMTKLEISDVTLASGASPTLGNWTDLPGSLIRVASASPGGAHVIGKRLSLRKTRNSPAVFVSGAGAIVSIEHTVFAKHIDGVLHAKAGASIRSEHNYFVENRAARGGCIFASGEGTSVYATSTVVTTAQAISLGKNSQLAMGGFACAQGRAHVHVDGANITLAAATKGGVFAAAGGATISANSLYLLNISAEISGALALAQDAGSEVRVSNASVIRAKAVRGAVVAAIHGGIVSLSSTVRTVLAFFGFFLIIAFFCIFCLVNYRG